MIPQKIEVKNITKFKFYCICSGSPLKVMVPLVKEVDAEDSKFGARPYCAECGRPMLPEAEYTNLLKEISTIYQGDDAAVKRVINRYQGME